MLTMRKWSLYNVACQQDQASKIKDNYFHNFSQRALFPETKLTVELTNMLKILNIVNFFYGHGS